jgi:hypothetical protein
MDRTPHPPFPDTARTGRAFISPCCTASVTEFLVDGQLWLAGSVAGHGWSQPWQGSVDDINDTGTLVDADGSERRIYWRPTAREPG